MILHNIHSSAAIPVDPFSTIGIGLADWLGLNTYDDAYVRLKKIAIADPPTKRRGYDDYYLIAVFDIRIAINARGSNGRGWRMLAATDLYPYTFEDAVRHLGRIFAVTSQGTCFIWLPSYGTGDYKRNAQTIICIPNGTPLFCRDQSSPDQNKIADPGCAFASAIRSNLEPCS